MSPSRGKVPRRERFATRGRERGLTVHARERGDAGGSAGLLVALRERIGLEQIGGLEDQLELAVELGLADAGLRPEVMVFMDPHVAFGRALEFDAGRSGCDLVDVEAAGLLAG